MVFVRAEIRPSEIFLNGTGCVDWKLLLLFNALQSRGKNLVAVPLKRRIREHYESLLTATLQLWRLFETGLLILISARSLLLLLSIRELCHCIKVLVLLEFDIYWSLIN